MNAPQGCTNLKLRQLSRLVTRHYERHFAASPLRITQYSLLSHVVRLGQATAGEVAAAMQLSPSALTRSLQPLVAQGWVELHPGADARQRLVVATAAGRAQRAAAQQLWKRAQLALNEQLGAAQVAALHGLLDQGIATLGPDTGEDDEP